MELVGTSRFDVGDEDWCCDEIADFGTRERPFVWKQKASWNEILAESVSYMKEYLKNGRFADVLKERSGLGLDLLTEILKFCIQNRQKLFGMLFV